VRLPGRYATVRWQIWQRVTGSWVTVTGKRREGDLLICIYHARPARVILHRMHATRTRVQEGRRFSYSVIAHSRCLLVLVPLVVALAEPLNETAECVVRLRRMLCS
jgi:hypothetical protein